MLAGTYGLFYRDDAFKQNGKEVSHTSIYSTGQASFKLSDVVDTANEVIVDLHKGAAFERFVNYLKATSYEAEPLTSPNFEKIYEDTLIFIGANGWQEVATIENCTLLLKSLSIEVRFGRQHIKAPLAKEP